MYLIYSILIQKQVSENTLFFAADIDFSVLMFQINIYLTIKIKNCELSYLYKN